METGKKTENEPYYMTKGEKRIYDYIRGFITLNKFSPTITDIAKGCYTSRSFVRHVLNVLHDNGLIDYKPKKIRTVFITKIDQ